VTPAPDALTVLIEALDGFARALETGRADAVLAAQELLAAAVSGIRTADLTLVSRNPDTRGRLEEAHHKLARCRAMGAAASGLSMLMGQPAYGPKGLHPVVPVPAATMASRV
jgi:hypothetical protein